MKHFIIIGLASLCWPVTAVAAETGHQWSLAVDGGTSTGESQPDQPFVSASITRDIGESYVQLSVSQIATADGGSVRDAIPATTRQVKIGAGTTFGAVSIDGYAIIGDRQFKSARIDRSGRTVSLETSGSTAGGGVSFTYDIALGAALFLSPYLAVDYNRIETARVLTRPSGAVTAVQQPETGVTASSGIAVQHLFGPHHSHAIAGLASFVTTSNDAAVDRSNAAGGAAKSLGILAGAGNSDSWGELGAIASFGLNHRLSVNIAGVRTIGFDGGDSLSISAGAKITF